LHSSQDLASSLYILGGCAAELDEKERLYTEALEMYRAALGKGAQDANIANTICALAQCDRQHRKPHSAERRIDEALAMLQTAHGRDACDITIASALHMKGDCLLDRGDHDRARESLEAALAMRRACCARNAAATGGGGDVTEAHDDASSHPEIAARTLLPRPRARRRV
jgi:tetratricopeptide (TPR) repeat protein